MKQISITIEGKDGALDHVVGLLSAGGIDIRALTVGAAGGRKGIEAKMLVNDLAAAIDILSREEIPYFVEDVLVVAVDDHPGGLHAMLKVLAEARLDLDHLYGFVSKKEGKALDVLSVKDHARAAAALRKHGIVILEEHHPGGRRAAHKDDDLADYLGSAAYWDEMEPRE